MIKSTEEDVELEGTELEDEEDTGVVVRSVHLSKVNAPGKENITRTGFEGIDDLLPEEVRNTSLLRLTIVPVISTKRTTRFIKTE